MTRQASPLGIDHLGSVLAVYGFDLGVRPQQGQTQEAFTDAARKADLRNARQKGLVAAAIVKWTE